MYMSAPTDAGANLLKIIPEYGFFCNEGSLGSDEQRTIRIPAASAESGNGQECRNPASEEAGFHACGKVITISNRMPKTSVPNQQYNVRKSLFRRILKIKVYRFSPGREHSHHPVAVFQQRFPDKFRYLRHMAAFLVLVLIRKQ